MQIVRQVLSGTFIAASLVLASVASITPAQAWKLKVLYNFTGGADGWGPNGGMVRDPTSGELYGTTLFGGAHGKGTVFKIASDRRETVLHSFTKELFNPNGGLVRDTAGSMYGTAFSGHDFAGAVFKVTREGDFSVLHRFPHWGQSEDGAGPQARLLLDDATGDIYGTTSYGGASNCGTVFDLPAKKKYKVLYSFAGGTDGCHPAAGLIQDKAGNLYGTTSAEGACDYCGVVFKLSPDGTETVLHRFNSRAGKLPYGGVVADGLGNLHGATSQGGANKDGVAFKITADGGFTVLHDFAGGQDGSYPFGDLLLRTSGSIYGTTQYGGAGYGVLYRLEQSGFKALYSFPEGLDFPQGSLIEDEYGNLFGAAHGFEPKGTYGAVFELMR